MGSPYGIADVTLEALLSAVLFAALSFTALLLAAADGWLSYERHGVATLH